MTTQTNSFKQRAISAIDFNRQEQLARETFRYNMLEKVYNSTSNNNELTELDMLTDELNLLKLLHDMNTLFN